MYNFEKINVYVPNNYKKHSINSRDSYPTPLLPDSEQFPHEGRVSFNIPDWMKDKYPELYKVCFI